MCHAHHICLVSRQSKQAHFSKCRLTIQTSGCVANADRLYNTSSINSALTQYIMFQVYIGQFGVYIPCEAKFGSTMLIRRVKCASNNGKCSRRCFLGWFLYSR